MEVIPSLLTTRKMECKPNLVKGSARVYPKSSRSSSREVRIRVPFFSVVFCSLF